MNKLKKIAAALAAAATVSALGVGAFAAYTDNYFFFDLNGKGDSTWSAKAEKEDNEDYAKLYTTGGYVSSSSPIYVSIYKEKSLTSSNQLSKSITITSPKDEYTLTYTTPRGIGSYCYLHANCGYNGAEVTGYWRP